ncbi:type II toxin-antitoxin system RelE/ParE family toxin [Paenibacillus glycinis]|uniref:Type II toxin-antitoxin system RelE/ParE family toxin n=1 Tax=Paenibacillus glycinis TaxID=2697035 RepID=A0ABW9Y0A0_9BACL|nr:type II toxin-antitoxin system RelE/ParE family toxin [Paenibacillus glycinis]NBD28381.1 type II toxin-antitoxin system RelE/ParE family toxin [Paenibacillus glycinis]
MYEIDVYKDARGNSPIQIFIDDLEQKAPTDKRAARLLKKLFYSVELLKNSGTRSGEQFTKQIDGKLWELRPDDHRVFFFMWNGNHIVLLHSFRKSGRKTPDLEIKQAKREMLDWISRHGY